MKVLIIAHYIQMPNEKGNNRFMYIANKLTQESENQVELVTSSFSHRFKKQRDLNDPEIKKLRYKITNLYEPGYPKNVCLKRFYSHHILGKNLKKYLNNLDYKPDVIYCAIPSLDVAKQAVKYAKKNKIRFIVDVQDLWPEAFEMVFHIPVLSQLIFLPMKRKADYIYKNADDIIAVSETYADRAAKVNKKFKNKESVFLGTELKYFDQCKNENIVLHQDNAIRLVYIGTLGHSYNLKCTIDALSILKEEGVSNIKFIVMGDGPLKEEFEKYAIQKKIDCEFKGRLPYEKMVGELCACDIAINPITKGSACSIINKVGDYAAASLPVINTQENEEYRKLIERDEIGLNCENDNSMDLAQKIKILYADIDLRRKLGNNNRKLAEKKFDREKTYQTIIDLILMEKK